MKGANLNAFVVLFRRILLKIVFIFDNNRKNSFIENYYGVESQKKVLISYITIPFRLEKFGMNNYVGHTNHLEAKSAAKIFHELGYQVDIIRYDRIKPIDLSCYDVIYGFGDVFERYYTSSSDSCLICYSTGMHVSHQNMATLQRLLDFHKKSGLWLGDSVRYVDKCWTHQTFLSDSVIALGNEYCAESYLKYASGSVYNLNGFYINTREPKQYISWRRKNNNRDYVWFGGGGALHKGADLVIDYFSENPDVKLHLCGAIERESGFWNQYKSIIEKSDNIEYHGFVDINSDKFGEILSTCSFAVYPSCSEGGSPALINLLGNGGLIPIVTLESTMLTGFDIIIEGFKPQDIHRAIEVSRKMTTSEIEDKQRNIVDVIDSDFTYESYKINLKKIIDNILKVHQYKYKNNV